MKKMSRNTSGAGCAFCCQLFPPLLVVINVPLLPTAHPRFSSKKKTECSHASDPTRGRVQAPVCAETGIQNSARTRLQKIAASTARAQTRRVIAVRREISTTGFRSPAKNVPLRKWADSLERKPTGKDSRKAKDR